MQWARGGSSSARLDGSDLRASFLPPGLEAVVLTAGGRHIYWAGFERTRNRTEIGMVRLDGSHRRRLYDLEGSVSGMAAHGRRLYLATGEGLDLLRVGAHRTPRRLVKEVGLVDVAVARGRLYWCNYGAPAPHASGSVHAARLNGTRSVRYDISGLHSPVSLAVGGGYVYWGNSEAQESIGRIRTDGTGAEPSFLSIPGFAVGLTWRASSLYWASSSLGLSRASNEIGRQNVGPEGQAIGERQTLLPLGEDLPYSLTLH